MHVGKTKNSSGIGAANREEQKTWKANASLIDVMETKTKPKQVYLFFSIPFLSVAKEQKSEAIKNSTVEKKKKAPFRSEEIALWKLRRRKNIVILDAGMRRIRTEERMIKEKKKRRKLTAS